MSSRYARRVHGIPRHWTRELLQEQLLEKEQRKFSLGGSTRADVIVVQRSLATARVDEVVALTGYSHARVSLDQVLGETLEKNNVSLREALEGRVARPSKLPEARSRSSQRVSDLTAVLPSFLAH